jgi:hypothetical protein
MNEAHPTCREKHFGPPRLHNVGAVFALSHPFFLVGSSFILLCFNCSARSAFDADSTALGLSLHRETSINGPRGNGERKPGKRPPVPAWQRKDIGTRTCGTGAKATSHACFRPAGLKESWRKGGGAGQVSAHLADKHDEPSKLILPLL